MRCTEEDNKVYAEERKLLNKLENIKEKKEILYFIKDFKVAATNNQGIIEEAKDIENNLPHDWTVEDNADESYTAISPNLNVFTVDKYGNITVDGSEEPTPPPSLPEGWDGDAISEIITETVDGVEYKVPIPKGYVASKVTGENTVEEGLVIYEGTEEVNDGNVETAKETRNQFVWIPVNAIFVNPYNYGSCSEPTELEDDYSSSGAAYDSQDTLDYLYGENYYNYEEDFAYITHYAEMVESVNKYNGFYIGRYETTIDGNKEIGSKYNTEVLTEQTILKEGTNPNISDIDNLYYYRWYGQYYADRNSNVTGNNDYLQTNMIWGQQWDAMIEYFSSKSIKYEAWGTSSQREIVNSGQSINDNGNDKIYNIYDLRTNGRDWTAEAYTTDTRSYRGGEYANGYSASFRSINNPASIYSACSSRLTLYIK